MIYGISIIIALECILTYVYKACVRFCLAVLVFMHILGCTSMYIMVVKFVVLLSMLKNNPHEIFLEAS